MRQLFQNLIGNGLKFHREDVPPELEVSAEIKNGKHPRPKGIVHDGPYCEIIVKDNGIGFEQKYVDRIFAVFQRLHGRSQYEGTGIGLSVCKKIAERHGGSITAESTPGQGAKFIVTLPVTQPEKEITEE